MITVSIPVPQRIEGGDMLNSKIYTITINIIKTIVLIVISIAVLYAMVVRSIELWETDPIPVLIVVALAVTLLLSLVIVE